MKQSFFVLKKIFLLLLFVAISCNFALAQKSIKMTFGEGGTINYDVQQKTIAVSYSGTIIFSGAKASVLVNGKIITVDSYEEAVFAKESLNEQRCSFIQNCKPLIVLV